jgi:hypothetical protein
MTHLLFLSFTVSTRVKEGGGRVKEGHGSRVINCPVNHAVDTDERLHDWTTDSL